MNKLQDLEVILGEAVTINNESHVLQPRVLKVMLPRELDFLGAVPDGVGDAKLLAPVEAERVQRRQRSPPEQQVPDEPDGGRGRSTSGGC
jgi:hypothetical protein